MKKLAHKITILALTISLALGILSIGLFYGFLGSLNTEISSTSREALMHDYDQRIQVVVEIAMSELQRLQRDVEAGTISRDEAMLKGADFLRSIRYDEDEYIFVDTSKGINVVNLGKATEGQSRWDIQDSNGTYLIREIIKAGMQEGGGYSEYWFPRAGSSTPEHKRTYSRYFAPFDWVVGTGNYITDINTAVAAIDASIGEARDAGAILLTIALALATILSSVAAMLFARRIARPLDNIARALDVLSQGDADLSTSLSVNSKDEIGSIALSFNAFVAKLNDILLTVRKATETLSESSVDLSSNTTETAAALNQISANIESVNTLIQSQSASVTQTSATVEEIVKNVEHFNNIISNQATIVEESSRSMERMSGDIGILQKEVSESTTLLSDLQRQSLHGREILDEMNSLIREIAGQSETLMEASEIISNIASQTNLLAMNAAIESAHAGEAGKGFAVVSDEIRKLAESAAGQAKEISTSLNGVKDMVQRISISSQESGEMFDGIADGIAKAAATEQRVSESLSRQVGNNAGLVEVFAGIRQLSLEIQSGSEEMSEGNRMVFEAMNRLVQLSEQVAGSMGEISSGTNEINQALHSITGLIETNNGSIASVVSLTRRFTLKA